MIDVALRYELLSRSIVRLALRNSTWNPVKLESNEIWSRIQAAVGSVMIDDKVRVVYDLAFLST